MAKIYLNDIEERDFIENIRKVIREELHLQTQNVQLEKLLSPGEVCKLFEPKISKVTLYNWTVQGKVKKHKLGRRVFYKYSEILDALKSLKRFINH